MWSTRSHHALNPSFRSWWWVVPLLWLAFALGNQYLADDEVWNDEVWTLKKAGGDPYPSHTPIEVWQSLAEDDPNHPPFYFVLLAGWGRLAGWEPLAGRAFSLLWGVLAVAMTYRLGAALYSRQVGFFAASVMSSSAFLAYYMHELRAYSMLVFITALTMLAYWKVVTATDKPAVVWQIALLGSISGLIYTNYVGIPLVVALGLWHLTQWRCQGHWGRTLVLLVGGSAAFLPWVYVFLKSLDMSSNMVLPWPEMSVGTMLIQIGYAFGNTNLPLLFIPLVYSIAVSEHGTRLLWFLLGTMLVVYLVMSLKTDILIKNRLRYFLPLWPVLTLLVALGIERLARRGLRPELFLGVWMAVGVWHSPGKEFARELSLDGSWTTDWNTLVTTVTANEYHGDAFVLFGRINADDAAFEYYASQIDSPSWFLREHFSSPAEREFVMQRVIDLTMSAQRFWLGYDVPPETFPATPFHHTLWSQYAYCGRYPAGVDFFLDLHARIPSTPDARFGDGLLPSDKVLKLGLVHPLPVQIEDALEVAMVWFADAGIAADTYTVGVSLVDEHDTIQHTSTFELPGAPHACIETRIDTSALMAGTYRLKITVYAWGALLPGSVADATLHNITLGTVDRHP